MKRDTDRHRAQTIRQEMISLLTSKEMNAKELSQAVGIREKEVYEHLSHMSRSVLAKNRRLVIMPFRCLACGYVFEERKRFTRPGRCPQCKKGHLQAATYRIR